MLSSQITQRKRPALLVRFISFPPYLTCLYLKVPAGLPTADRISRRMSQRNPVLHFPQWPVPPPAQGSPAERAAQCSIKLPQGTGGAAMVLPMRLPGRARTAKAKPFGLMANKKSENEHHTACGTFVRHRQTGIILAILLGRKSPGHKTKKASNISRRTQEYY